MNTRIIKQPVITEKSVAQAANSNVYTFIVDRSANKTQIKEAVKQLFGVDVVAVNTNRHYLVKKRTGKKRMNVLLAPTKKASVTVKKGQTIEIFDFEGQATN